MKKRNVFRRDAVPARKDIEKRMDFTSLKARYASATGPGGGGQPSALSKLVKGGKPGWFAGGVAVIGAAVLLFGQRDGGGNLAGQAVGEGVTITKVPAALTDDGNHTYVPPFEGRNVPFIENTVQARRGAELVYPSGTRISIPPLAFLGGDGKTVTEKVTVRYREFSDPYSLLLCGIPMKYDTADKREHLESAGMMEVRAYDAAGREVFINPAAPIRVELASDKAGTEYNLYRFDEATGNWAYKGKDEVTVYESGSSRKGRRDSDGRRSRKSAPFPDVMPGMMPGPKDSAAIKKVGVRNLVDYTPVVKKWKAEAAASGKRFNFMLTDVADKDPGMTALDGLVYHYDRGIQQINNRTQFFEELLSNPFKGGNFIYRYWDLVKLTYNLREPTDYLTLHFIKSEAGVEDPNREKPATSIRLYPSFEDKFEGMTCAEIFRLYRGMQDSLTRAVTERQYRRAKKRNPELAESVYIARSFYLDGFGIWNCDKIFRFFSPQDVVVRFVNKTGDSLKYRDLFCVYTNPRSIIRSAGIVRIDRRDTENSDMMLVAVLGENRIGFVRGETIVAVSREAKEHTFVMETGTLQDLGALSTELAPGRIAL